jgi:hypothetical protein
MKMVGVLLVLANHESNPDFLVHHQISYRYTYTTSGVSGFALLPGDKLETAQLIVVVAQMRDKDPSSSPFQFATVTQYHR